MLLAPRLSETGPRNEHYAGDMLAYSIQIKCGLIEPTYDYFWPEWERPEWEHLMLSLGSPECSDVFLLGLSAKIAAFCKTSASNSVSLPECSPAAA